MTYSWPRAFDVTNMTPSLIRLGTLTQKSLCGNMSTPVLPCMVKLQTEPKMTYGMHSPKKKMSSSVVPAPSFVCAWPQIKTNTNNNNNNNNNNNIGKLDNNRRPKKDSTGNTRHQSACVECGRMAKSHSESGTI